MRNPTTISLTILTITLAACGQNAPPADPSRTRTTGVSVESGPMSNGDPSGGGVDQDGPRATSGSPASPMEGGCKDVSAPLNVKDRQTCLNRCQGFDDTVPLGSACLPQKTSCMNQCKAKFTE